MVSPGPRRYAFLRPQGAFPSLYQHPQGHPRLHRRSSILGQPQKEQSIECQPLRES